MLIQVSTEIASILPLHGYGRVNFHSIKDESSIAHRRRHGLVHNPPIPQIQTLAQWF